MNPPADQPNKLIHVRGKLHRVTLHMKPCQPLDGPVAHGPLIRVGNPLQRATLHFEPVPQPRLELTFSVDPARDLTAEMVFAKVLPTLELVKSTGFAWDRTNPISKPGRITVAVMSREQEPPTELPVIERNDLTLTSNLTPAELGDLLQRCRMAVASRADVGDIPMRPVEFDDEPFREQLEEAATRHVKRAAGRNAHPPTPQQIQDESERLGRKLTDLVQDYINTCGPLDIREERPDE